MPTSVSLVWSGAIDEDVPTLNVSQLASQALQLGLLGAHLADAINGLEVLRLMAAVEHDRLDLDRAMEFVALCAGVLSAIRRIRGPRTGGWQPDHGALC